MVMMSLIQFDEMYEICCGMLEGDENLNTVKSVIKELDLMKDCIPDSNHWWEAAVREILYEKENELFYV
jgi:hypothetical protein